jgi:hypothetical protein
MLLRNQRADRGVVYALIAMCVWVPSNATLEGVLVLPGIMPEAGQSPPPRRKRRSKPLSAGRRILKVFQQAMPALGRRILQAVSVAALLWDHMPNTILHAGRGLPITRRLIASTH